VTLSLLRRALGATVAPVFSRFALSCQLLVAASSSLADGWATFGDHAALKNHVVADVGEVSKVAPPPDTKLSEDVFQINGRCFIFSGLTGFWGYGSKPALVLVNVQKQFKLALVESSIGSIRVEVKEITLVQCPQASDVLPYSGDPQERLELLQKRQEELKRRLEELQKRGQN